MAEKKPKGDDKAVSLILEGEGVNPETVSPKAAARLIWEFVELLEELSDEINVAKGSLKGLRIVNGSFEVRTHTNTHVAAIAFQNGIHRFAGPPTTREELVKPKSARVLKLEQRGILLRKAITGIAPHLKVRTQVGARKRLLQIRLADEQEGQIEFVSARVVMAGIQATEEESSRALFQGVLDGASYSLAVNRDQEAKLITAFRGELEIDAEVTATRDGALRGRLLSFDSIATEGGDLDAWREWFTAAGWEGVTLREAERELYLGD